MKGGSVRCLSISSFQRKARRVFRCLIVDRKLFAMFPSSTTTTSNNNFLGAVEVRRAAGKGLTAVYVSPLVAGPA